MIRAILAFSLRRRALVLTITAACVAWGLYNLSQLAIDAVPDVTNRQVQINALAPALSAPEVERRVTFPLEMALGGLPHSTDMRSLSQAGLAQVTLVFSDDTDIYQARQWTAERLQGVDLPPGVTTEMAPVSTGLGEVLYVRLFNPGLSLRERRGLLDWVVRPRLRTVPGMAAVNTWGGEVRQLHVNVDPRRLVDFGVGFDEVVRAVQANNANGGGAFVVNGPVQQVVQVQGALRDVSDLANLSIPTPSGPPLWLRDMARLEEGAMLRQGAITQNGRGEEAYAICLLLLGENGSVVVDRVKRLLPELERQLPPGSQLETFLDRSRLIHATLATAGRNLLEGGVLVVGLLFFFLLQLRAGLIVSSVIPLAMLAAVSGMRAFGISANLMSLGALDFGIIVDGSVIIVENCVRRLSEARHRGPVSEAERLRVLTDAAVEVRQATQFGELLILASYLPILTLAGVEGKMFRPMGWTVILALLGSMACTLTVVPALCGVFLKAEREREHPGISWLMPRYQALLQVALRFPQLVVITALLVAAVGLGLGASLGSEFIPELAEGAVAVQTTWPPGTSLAEAVRLSSAAERTVMRTCAGLVERAVTRIGRPEIATDPMLPCQTDLLVELRPGASQPEVQRRLMAALGGRPGADVSFTQPIKMRMLELIEGIGIRADLGLKIFGDDLEELGRQGRRVARIVRSVPGAADVTVELTQGLRQLQLEVDRLNLSQRGVTIEDVNRVIEHAVGCRPASSLNDGNRRLDIVVRLPEELRNDPAAIGSLPVTNARGEQVPLRQLVTFRQTLAPVQISRENGRRRVVVQANVRGRDLGGFVEEVRRRLDAELHLPTGYSLRYAGTYEKLQSGRARLAVVVPLTFLLVGGLLYVTFGSARHALLVFASLPLAVTGGVLALWLRSMALSISAAVGFVALGGVAVLNGVVMLTFIEQLRKSGLGWEPSAVEGSIMRLRPVLMTASVAALGFVPMAFSQGAGAEVQRPLATVVIGGLLSSTLLTLFVLPAAYGLVEKNKRPSAREDADGPRGGR